MLCHPDIESVADNVKLFFAFAFANPARTTRCLLKALVNSISAALRNCLFVCFIPLQSFKSPLPFSYFISIFIIIIGFSTIFTQQ